jgi:hypothetical protein
VQRYAFSSELPNISPTFLQKLHSIEEKCARNHILTSVSLGARAIIAQKGFMTLYDYAHATLQSRSVASKDLRQIVADTTSGIITYGTHSHKVWVANDSPRQTERL